MDWRVLPVLCGHCKRRRGFEATRPDVEHRYPVGVRASHVTPLAPEGQAEVAARVAEMLEAAVGDWGDILGVTGAPSPAWVDAFDRYYDRERVAEVLEASDPENFGNELVVLCCELGAVLGAVLRREAPALDWVYDWPYWESGLLDPAHGYRINVFHWAMRKFSADEVDGGQLAKVEQCRRLVVHGLS